jgi:hypothetical protein
VVLFVLFISWVAFSFEVIMLYEFYNLNEFNKKQIIIPLVTFNRIKIY